MNAWFLLCFTSWVWGAPYPGLSPLLQAEKGLFRSQHGFSISGAGTDWAMIRPTSKTPSLETMYRSPQLNKGVQPSLSVRVDTLTSPSTLKSYVRRWMKDYSRFGFDITEAKPVRISGEPAFLLDLDHREQPRRLRQVVFLQSSVAVILTCRDHREFFQKSVEACNSIIRSFTWKKKTDF